METLPLGTLLGTLALAIVWTALFGALRAAQETLASQRSSKRKNERPGLAFALPTLLFCQALGQVVVTACAVELGAWRSGAGGAWGGALVALILLLVICEFLPRRAASRQPQAFITLGNALLPTVMRVLHPLAWVLDQAARLLLKPFAVKQESLNEPSEEPAQRNQNLLEDLAQDARANKPQIIRGIQALDSITVNDILVPRNEVDGIDLDDSIEQIIEQLIISRHTRLPVYHNDINQVERVLNTKLISHLLPRAELTKEALLAACYEAYFIPESTPLQMQLLNFHKQQRRLGMVVDEYGEVLGLVTLEDILEEIVGEFEDEQLIDNPHIHPQPDGRYVVEGAASIRDLNRSLSWHLPSDGPKTLNGLVTEALESIPDCAVCLKIGRYRLEILETEDNRASRVLIWYMAPVPRAL